MKNLFHKISNKISAWTGTALAFSAALSIVLIWALTGPIFKFSNTWQLVINTGTTVITFLMVFLIQNTQNRDSKAMQLKLDEIIRSSQARNNFLNIEDLSDEELHDIDEEFKKLHQNPSNINPAMHKLHKRITAAKQQRQSLGARTSHIAGQVAGILNPFSNNEHKTDDDKDNSNTDQKDNSE